MRRIINIVSIVTLLCAAVSCTKSDRIYDSSQQEIIMNPVLSAMSKTYSGPVVDEYPEGESFGVFAHYSQSADGAAWSGPGQPYLEDCKFVNTSGTCSAATPAYWPFDGSLIIAGYSPYYKADGTSRVENVAFTSAGVLSITNYVTDGVSDLMYFLPTYTSGSLVGIGKKTDAFPISFYHALAQISFVVKAKEGDEENIILKQIQILNANMQGTFRVNANDPDGGVWSSQGSPGNMSVFSSAGQTILAGSPIEVQRLLIPDDAATIRVIYDIDRYPEDNIDELWEMSKDFTPADLSVTEWELGKKYTYTITIGARKIEASPSVSWSNVGGSDKEL